MSRWNLSGINIIGSGYKCNTLGTLAVKLAYKDELNFRHNSSEGIITDNGKGHSGARLIL